MPLSHTSRSPSSHRTWFGVACAVVVTSAGCPPKPTLECSVVSDCAADERCVGGACIPLEGSEGEGEGAVGEGEGEGDANQQECPTNRRSCDSDRVCAGGFCDKDHDSADGVTGDGIAAENDPVGCCVLLVCSTDSDCDVNEACDIRRGVCLPADLCDPSAADACTGGVCLIDDDAASCGTAAAATSCEVVTAGTVIEGAHVPLAALALQSDGRPAPYASFTFTVDKGALDANGVYTGCALSDGPCAVTITAHDGAVTCTGALTVLPASDGVDTRVVVLDAATRAPLAGVVVQGAAFAKGVVSATTDANGVAALTGLYDAVSALAVDHDWHTVLAPPVDVVLYARATPDATQVSGKKGSFDLSTVHTTGDVKLAFGGLALPSLVDLDLERVVGEVAEYNLNIEGITDPGGQLVTFPSTEQMTLGSSAIKGDWVALGDAKLAWALGVDAQLAELGPVFSILATETAHDLSGLIETASVFPTADHAYLVVDADSGARPSVDPANPDAPVAFDAWPFTSTTLAPSTQAFFTRTIQLSEVPSRPQLLAVAAARVPGRGFVPLGVTSANVGSPEAPILTLGFAPPHDGLEGSPVTVALVSVDGTEITDAHGADASVSATFANVADITDATTFGPFLPPAGGTFANGAFAASTDIGADVYRVQLDSTAGRWIIWSSTPTSFDTAALTDGSLGTRADHARVEAIELSTGSFDALVSADGADIGGFDANVARISSAPL